jgi:acyl-coenzyme A synthetase/AMP-(fatty) acid ligase/acyl carrier protein
VDCLKIVPSHLSVLLSGTTPQAVLPRRCLVLGGEATNARLAARIRELSPDCEVYNHYGPTETTVGVSTFRLPAAGLTSGSTLPIGRPLSGVTIHLLDDSLAAQPIGAPGEVYIGGAGVARGYLGQPAATAGRFVPDPWGERGARLYRTGDLARRLADGTIEFLGRIDGQVKVRGYRIELSEIEAVLGGIAGIREGAVVLTGEDAGDRRLVAYAVQQSEMSLSPSNLRAALRERLPEYMVPLRFVFLETLPRLPSGKIDRRALVGLDAGIASSAEQDFVAPRTPLEERLAEVWAEVLRLPRVGVHDDFFEHLGGHSLLATQAISRLRRQLHLDLPLRSIFDLPTVARLAQSVADQLASEMASEEMERLLDELEEMPSAGSSGGALS